MALDDVDTALADYEPGENENDVQDESVRMQNMPEDSNTAPAQPQLDSEQLDTVANTPSPVPGDNAVMSPAALGNPNPMQAANSALAAGQNTAKAQDKVGEAMGGANEAKAQELDDRAVQEALDNQEATDLAKAHADALERTHASVEAEQKKYADFKFRDHWKDASPFNKVLATVFAGIGGAAQARLGGDNEVIKTMNDISEREYKQDVNQLSRQEQMAKWKREGETDLQARFEKERAGLQIQQAQRLKMMADLAQSRYLKTHPGSTPEEAKNNVIARGLEQKSAETYSNAVRDIYKIEASKEAAKLKARHAGGTPGVTGEQMAALAAYEKEHPGDDEGMYRQAAHLGVSPKLIISAVTAARAPAEKRAIDASKEGDRKDKAESNMLKDPWTGDVIGPSSSPRATAVARKSQASGVQLVDTLKSYKQFLEKHGTKNWSKEDIAEGESKWADAVGQGRVWSELPSSEAGLELENAKYGGKPVVWDLRPTSLNVINEQIKHVENVTRQRANILAGKPANYVPTHKGSAPSGNSGIPTDVIERARARAKSGDAKAQAWLKGHGLDDIVL
jgi:hypothetical protein